MLIMRVPYDSEIFSYGSSMPFSPLAYRPGDRRSVVFIFLLLVAEEQDLPQEE